MRVSVSWFVFVASITLSACASVPLAPPAFDQAAKSFGPPPPDRAHVYVYRNETFGAAVKMDLKLSGQPVGRTAAKTFTLLPVAVRPGAMYTLTSEAENTSDLVLMPRPGEIIFVWQEVKMGFLSARSRLQIVDPQKGMAGVRECELIAYPPPPLPPSAYQPPPAPIPPAQVQAPAPAQIQAPTPPKS